MKRLIRMGGILLLTAIFSTAAAIGADQERKRDQKKDGSCQTGITENTLSVELAADQTRDRDRTKDQKKDGSCNS